MEASNEIGQKFRKSCLLPALNTGITLGVFKFWGNMHSSNAHLKYTEKIGANTSHLTSKRKIKCYLDHMLLVDLIN